MALNALLTLRVSVITLDSKYIVGTLISCDNQMNLVLEDAYDRIIRSESSAEPSEIRPFGIYLVRGDNVALCGRVDEEMDKTIDWTRVRGEPIGTTRHAA
ncbi:hypothetical protein P154DRAFT_528261 [Amniculicola lignicola CBS 123094]|uniref:LSM2-LSM8 complex subunit LSM8 n=1 Tax=Amniculicola lignicola CBS 123094 TaxID=1392246 RepID=A0A6A5VXV3_9PLEO|nr:hypothetical protein P154DRAFT_528261 [Amniculicola lignicola CBS 123094]